MEINEIIKIRTDKLKEEYIRYIIGITWGKINPDEYNIEINGDFVEFDNFTIPFEDFVLIGKHKISEKIFIMYNDFKSLNYEHSLITEALKENPEIKDYNFYEFFLKFRENDKKDNFIDSTTILIANNRLLDAINKFNKELFDK